MKYLGLWVTIVILFVVSSNATPISLSDEEHLEMENELRLLNKPPVLTYQTEEGDTIDCIDINKQPAFDHPLLKNHKLQRRPSMYPVTTTNDGSSRSKASELVFQSNRKPCPTGTVPIRRTQKEDLIRAKTLSKSPIENAVNPVSFPNDKYVVSLSMKPGPRYYGATATMSSYNLSIAQDQSSSTNIWVIGGPPSKRNVILAGWQVNRAVNGDDLTRMFIYWTADGAIQTGCYNMLCRGFVQIDPKVIPSAPILPTSFIGGEQYDIKFYVYQDRATGNWLLTTTQKNYFIGYWPKELFGELSNGADQVAWGGIAKPGQTGLSPPLGSGNKPTGNFRLACYLRNIRYVDNQNLGQSPSDSDHEKFIHGSDCYDLYNDRNCGHDEMYYCFTYGGPGGKCGV